MLKFITHRSLWINILVGVLLAVGVFSVFVISLNWLTHHNVSRTVPQVTGKPLEEAESILEKAGFEVKRGVAAACIQVSGMSISG